MDYIADAVFDYIRPELTVLAVVLYVLGMFLKRARAVRDGNIPFILSGVGIVLALLWVLTHSPITSWQDVLLALFTAVMQGFLTAGAAVLVSQYRIQHSRR